MEVFNFEEFLAYLCVFSLIAFFGAAFELGKHLIKYYFEFEDFLKECEEEQE